MTSAMTSATDDQDPPLEDGPRRAALGCRAAAGASGGSDGFADAVRLTAVAVVPCLPAGRRRWGCRRRRSPGCSTAHILAGLARGIGRGSRASAQVPAYRARSRAAAAAPRSTRSGGATTVASGPRPSSRRSSQAGLAHREHDRPRAVRRRGSADSYGWLSTTQSAAGARRERDPRVVGARVVHEVAHVVVTPRGGSRSARRSARTARTRSTRKRRSPSAR